MIININEYMFYEPPATSNEFSLVGMLFSKVTIL